MDRLRIFTECGGRSLRNVSGFLPDVKDEAYELFANFYRMWWTRLTDCLRIFTGCGGRSLRIVYRFAPDLGEQACGLFMDLDRIGGEGLRIWGSLGAGTLKQQPASACAQVHWHTYSSDIQLPISITKSM